MLLPLIQLILVMNVSIGTNLPVNKKDLSDLRRITTTLAPYITAPILLIGETQSISTGRIKSYIDIDGKVRNIKRDGVPPKSTDSSQGEDETNKIFLVEESSDTDEDGNTTNNHPNRSIWIVFLSIFGVVVVVCILMAFVNTKRLGSGRRPVYGTSWLTPPSYWQSQRDYNTNRGEEPDENVPTYSERPNEAVDLGFYDQQGEFHLSGPAAEYSSNKEEDNDDNEDGITDTTQVTQLSSNTTIQSGLQGGSNSLVSHITLPETAITTDHLQSHTIKINPHIPANDTESNNR